MAEENEQDLNPELKKGADKLKEALRNEVEELFWLNPIEKQVILACLLVRNRSFLLFSVYILLGEYVFPLMREFSGKTLKFPPKWVLAKYVRYARIYHQLKGKDITDNKLVIKVARANRVRAHQVIPIFKKVEKSLAYFNRWVQQEMDFGAYLRKPESESEDSSALDEHVGLDGPDVEADLDSGEEPDGPKAGDVERQD